MKRSLPEYAPDPRALERMLDFLNDGRFMNEKMSEDDQSELHRLMDDWLSARANWNRFVGLRLKEKRSLDFTRGTFHIQTEGSEPLLIPSPPRLTKHEHAKGVFLQFVLHPERRRLSLRCRREQCQRYFVRTSAHEKFYCSTRCAKLDTAVEAMRAKRTAERDARIKRVKAALVEYSRGIPNRRERRLKDWRIFVEAKTRETPRILNGWVERGWITPPQEKGK